MEQPMGRPPIGKVAMTGAERTRLYRLKRGIAKPVTKPVTKPKDAAAMIGALQKQLAAAKARIAELEAGKAAIDPATFSMSAQKRMEAWQRQRMAAMMQSFQQIVRDEVHRRIDEIILPDWRHKIKEAKLIYERRKGIMDKATFKLIWSALHPDSRKSISDKKLAEAFDAFSAMEKYLLNEKDSPTTFGDVPSSLAEWDKVRAAATAGGKAKRAATQASSLKRR
jgi:hypothetical protein